MKRPNLAAILATTLIGTTLNWGSSVHAATFQGSFAFEHPTQLGNKISGFFRFQDTNIVSESSDFIRYQLDSFQLYVLTSNNELLSWTSLSNFETIPAWASIREEGIIHGSLAGMGLIPFFLGNIEIVFMPPSVGNYLNSFAIRTVNNSVLDFGVSPINYSVAELIPDVISESALYQPVDTTPLPLEQQLVALFPSSAFFPEQPPTQHSVPEPNFLVGFALVGLGLLTQTRKMSNIR